MPVEEFNIIIVELIMNDCKNINSLSVHDKKRSISYIFFLYVDKPP